MFFVFLHEVKNCPLKICEELCSYLIETALQIAFGRMATLTLLILPTQEHGRSFLVSSIFSSVFLSFYHVSFSTCFTKVILRYFILFRLWWKVLCP